MILSLQELRVLGALIEKEIATPDTYPLSLNALQAACNQRSSRDPVLDLSEEEIRQALHSLEDRGLASPARGGVSSPNARVAKYEHHARAALHLRRDETALLCLLLLRGPQTPGDLRARADRLHAFEDLASVVATLDRLAGRPPAESAPEMPGDAGPLVAALARSPGAREIRYTHLLGGGPPAAHTPPGPAVSPRESFHRGADSIDPLAAATLLARIDDLERRVAMLEAPADPTGAPGTSD